jgi:choline kinase
MHAVILAAGEGSRLAPYADDVPKAFMDLAGRTLYDRQRAALAGHVDAVTVVLGYAHERVVDGVGDARTVVLENWADYENAESLRQGLAGIDDDVLVLNGDVVVTDSAVGRVVDTHAGREDRSVVAAIRGDQTESTAVRCDPHGIVTEYGLISGHRHAGLGVVDASHLEPARRYLRSHRSDWYPGLYTTVETELVPIPATHHIEINYPEDLVAARRRLPLDGADEVDLQT